jgi:hypothetical protein
MIIVAHDLRFLPAIPRALRSAYRELDLKRTFPARARRKEGQTDSDIYKYSRSLSFRKDDSHVMRGLNGQ